MDITPDFVISELASYVNRTTKQTKPKENNSNRERLSAIKKRLTIRDRIDYLRMLHKCRC